MKLKEANSGFLCNFEVLDLLRSRGPNKEGIASFAIITTAENKVYEYLSQSPAGTQTHELLRKLFKQIEHYNLTKAECLQVANLRPSTAVEIHLIVEDCEERMTEEAVSQFLEIVDALPKPPEEEAPPQEEEMEEEDEETEDQDEETEDQGQQNDEMD